MTALLAFSDILTSLSRAWSSRNKDQCFLSLALPISGIDPLIHLPILAKDQHFRFLWDFSSCNSLAASGKCQYLDLNGPRRFDQAQRFTDSIFSRLLDLTPESPVEAKPKILFAFSFFEEISENSKDSLQPPPLQAVFPKWQLSRLGESTWLRINGVAINEADARALAENLWLMAEELINTTKDQNFIGSKIISGISFVKEWKSSYQPLLRRGIHLVNTGLIEKLVLAIRQSITLHEPLDPLTILYGLRHQQQGSCGFLWQNNFDESFFGASPERLLKLQGDSLLIDALAGTMSQGHPSNNLLKSEKDRREHSFVVSSIVDELVRLDLTPGFSPVPSLVQYGKLIHLHTPIHAKVSTQRALQLVNALHPTPAVAGFPLRDAMDWIRALEPFERGRYAAPIGWINSAGDSEFRVAIRSGISQGRKLHLMAGAGLVKGSKEEKELNEVGLKFAVLQDQFDLTASN